MLFYKDTSQREGKGVTRINVNKYVKFAAKALVLGEPIVG